MPTGRDADAVTLEIFRNVVDSVAEEMTASLIHTAYSTNIKDRQDASCGVYDRAGEMVSQEARGGPVHTGTMKFAVSRILEKFDPGEMRPGDVFAYNTPYPVGPHHLNDLTVVGPAFDDGEVFAFTASQAHHVDMGGTEPGSMPFGVTEIYQEGLQIPPVRLFEAGEVDRDVLDIVTQNVRTARVTEGDIWAQHAAASTGERRIHELLERFGDRTGDLIRAVKDYAERRMREGIDALPDGNYEFEDVVEGDSIDDDDIRIHAAVTVEGDSIRVDFSGSDDQVRGPMNYRPSGVIACVQYAMQAIVDPRVPTNAGTYRPVEVRTRPGSVLEPEYPAPVCSAGMVTAQRIVDVLFGALAEAVPEQVSAACSGTMNLFNIGGVHPETGEYFNYVETYGGGQGAMHDADGMDGVHTHMTNTRNAPVEVLEHAYPFQVEGYSLVEESEGAGRHRGGMGIERDIRLVTDEVRVTLSSDRQRVPPWGLDGGDDAAPSECVLVSAGEERDLPPKFSTRIEDCGARIVTRTPGGGGWGDPEERDPARVRADVRAGLLSRERAREVYGVVLTDDLEVDETATADRRA